MDSNRRRTPVAVVGLGRGTFSHDFGQQALGGTDIVAQVPPVGFDDALRDAHDSLQAPLQIEETAAPGFRRATNQARQAQVRLRQRQAPRGVNYGRDSDSIASMGGALAGALGGIGAVPREWVDDVSAASRIDVEEAGREIAVVAAEIFAKDAARHEERARVMSELRAGEVPA